MENEKLIWPFNDKLFQDFELAVSKTTELRENSENINPMEAVEIHRTTKSHTALDVNLFEDPTASM